MQAPSEGASAPPVFDEALQDSLLATATAQAIGTSLAITDATDIVLQLRIDSMLPLMSTTEVRTLVSAVVLLWQCCRSYSRAVGDWQLPRVTELDVPFWCFESDIEQAL